MRLSSRQGQRQQTEWEGGLHAQPHHAGAQSGSNFARQQLGRKQLNEARQAVYSQDGSNFLSTQNPGNVDTSPDLLVAASSIPDPELRQLFQEVQQFCGHKRIGQSSDPAQLAAAYKRASQRLEHLPAAPVETAGGGVMMAPLPGPRGVLGYDFDSKGRVHESAARRMGRYLAMSPHAKRILRQMAELEQARPKVPAGLEDDPELVRLWRRLGGPRHRHHNLHASDRQADAPLPDPKKPRPSQPASFGHKGTNVSQSTTSSRSPSSPPVHAAWKLTQERASSNARTHLGRSHLPAGQEERAAHQGAASVSFGARTGGSSTGSDDDEHGSSKDSEDDEHLAAGSAAMGGQAKPSEGGYSAGAWPPKSSLKKGWRQLLKAQKTDAETQAEIAELVEGLYRPLTTVAGQATNDLEDVVKDAGLDEDEQGCPLFEPSDSEPDPVFSSLLPKSPDASSDSFDSTPATTPGSSRAPSTVRGRRYSRASRHSSSDEEYSIEELLGMKPCRKRRSSGAVTAADTGRKAQGSQFSKFRQERRRSQGRHLFFDTQTEASSRKSAHSRSSSDDVDDVLKHRPLVPLPEGSYENRDIDQPASEGLPNFTSGGGGDDEDSALDVLANTVLSLRQRQKVLHDISSRPSSRHNSRPGSRALSRAGSIPLCLQQSELLSAHEVLRGATEKIRSIMAQRLGNQESIKGTSWMEGKLSSQAYQVVSGFADKWSVENDTAGMKDLASRLKSLLQVGPAPGKDQVQRTTQAAVSRRVAQAQRINSPLLDLALGCHKLNKADMEVITDIVRQANEQARAQGGTPITVLKAGGSVLGVEGVSGLTQVLLKACPEFEDVDVSHCPFFGAWGCGKLAALMMSSSVGSRLTKLNLTGCPIQDLGCKKLAEGLSSSTGLTHLWLQKCDITDTGLQALSDVLRADTPLMVLYLSNNTFSGAGLQHFANGMESNTHLHELYLRDCFLCDDAAPALARIITQARLLQLLDASANCISAPGAAVIAAGLHFLEPHSASLLESAMQQAAANQPPEKSTSSSNSNSLSQRPSLTGGAALLKHVLARAHKGVNVNPMEGAGRQRMAAALREEARKGGVASGLHTLLLGQNPLGCDGVILLLKALAQLQGSEEGNGCSLRVLGLDGVTCDSSSELKRLHEQRLRAPVALAVPRPQTSSARAKQEVLLHPPKQEQEEEERRRQEEHAQQEQQARQQQQQQQKLREEQSTQRAQQSWQLQVQQASAEKHLEMAEQCLPPLLRQEMERARLVQAHSKEKEERERGAAQEQQQQQGVTEGGDVAGQKDSTQQDGRGGGGTVGGERGAIDASGAAQPKKKKVKKPKAADEQNAGPPTLPPPYFDPALPNGVYCLDLSLEEHRKVASQLVDLYKETEGLAWTDAWIDGQHMPAAPRGPAAKSTSPSPTPAPTPPTKPSQPGAASANAQAAQAKQKQRQQQQQKQHEGAEGGRHSFSGGLQRRPEPLWPGGSMPEQGHLKVHVMRVSSVHPPAPPTIQLPPPAEESTYATPRPETSQGGRTSEGSAMQGLQPMSDVMECCVVNALQSPLADDVWRLAVVERVTNVACVSSERAARILACFAYSKMQVDAALLLLTVCTDVHTLLPALLDLPPTPLHSSNIRSCNPLPAQGCEGNAAHAPTHLEGPLQPRMPVMSIPTAAAFVQRVSHQALELVPLSLPPGSEAGSLCNGRYMLNLGLQSHLFMACLVMSTAAAKGPQPKLTRYQLPWAASAAAAPQDVPSLASQADSGCDVASWAVVTVNDASACIHDLKYNGSGLLPASVFGHLCTHELPVQGTLELTFISPTNAARATPAAAKKVSAADARAAASKQATAISGGGGGGGTGTGAQDRDNNDSGIATAVGREQSRQQQQQQGHDREQTRMGLVSRGGWLGGSAAGRAAILQQKQQQQAHQEHHHQQQQHHHHLHHHNHQVLGARQQQQQQQQQVQWRDGTSTVEQMPVVAGTGQLAHPLVHHTEMQEHVTRIATLWEYLCMTCVDFGQISTISKEVERGQHTGYEGWMGDKLAREKPLGSVKSLAQSGVLSRAQSRAPSCMPSRAASMKYSESLDQPDTPGSLAPEPSFPMSMRKSFAGSKAESKAGSFRSGTSRMGPFKSVLGGSSALSGRPLAFVQYRVAAGSAWAACFSRCVSRLGLEGDLKLELLKREAARIWNDEGYEQHSLKFQLDGEARRMEYLAATLRKQEEQQAQQEAQDTQANPQQPEQGGQGKGSQGKHGGKKKPGSPKGGRPAMSAKEKAAADAHARNVEALLDTNCRRASGCLSDIAGHAAAFPVTVFQAAALLSLLPDVAQRMQALLALLPAITDTPRLLDLVVVLDAPALLPHLPPPPTPSPKSKLKSKPSAELQPRMSLAETRDQGGDSFKVLLGHRNVWDTDVPVQPLTEAEPRNRGMLVAPLTGTPEQTATPKDGEQPAATAVSAFAMGAYGLGLLGMSNSISHPQGIARVHASAVATAPADDADDASMGSREGGKGGGDDDGENDGGADTEGKGGKPEGLQHRGSSALKTLDREHQSHLLLLAHMHRVAQSLGWTRLHVPLTATDEMQGDLIVVLDDVGDVSQLQTLLRMCRMADRCREVPLTDGPGLIEAATDGGVLELQHEGTWSYWEQVLGWACWRPWAPPEPPAVKSEKPKANAPKPGTRTPAAAPAPAANTATKKKKKRTGPHPPKLGRVALRFRLTQPHQEWAAAILIQSVWRGWAVRQLRMAGLRASWLPSGLHLQELQTAEKRLSSAKREASEKRRKESIEGEVKKRISYGDKLGQWSSWRRVSRKGADSFRGDGKEPVSPLPSARDRAFSLPVELGKHSSGLPRASLQSRTNQPDFQPHDQDPASADEEEEAVKLAPLKKEGNRARASSTGNPNPLLLHQLHQDELSEEGDRSQISSRKNSSSEDGRGSSSSRSSSSHENEWEHPKQVDTRALTSLAARQASKAARAASAVHVGTAAGAFTGSRPTSGQQQLQGQWKSLDLNQALLTEEGGDTSRTQTSNMGRQEAARLARNIAAQANAAVAASAFCQRAMGAKVPHEVAARWHFAWAAYKARRRECRLQLLAKRLFISFAHQEMQANADHLFPWPPTEPAQS